jgi:hypothetical protein
MVNATPPAVSEAVAVAPVTAVGHPPGFGGGAVEGAGAEVATAGADVAAGAAAAPTG